MAVLAEINMDSAAELVTRIQAIDLARHQHSREVCFPARDQ
jgi:hypothetical protein